MEILLSLCALWEFTALVSKGASCLLCNLCLLFFIMHPLEESDCFFQYWFMWELKTVIRCFFQAQFPWPLFFEQMLSLKPDHLTGPTLGSLNDTFNVLCGYKTGWEELRNSHIWFLLFLLALFSLARVQTHSNCCAALLQKQITFPQALPLQFYKEIHSTVQETLVCAPH